MGGRLADQLNLQVGDDTVLLLRINRSVLLGRCPVRKNGFPLWAFSQSVSSSIAAVSLFALRMPSVCFVCPGGFTGYRVACKDLFATGNASQYLYHRFAASDLRVRSWMVEFGTLYQAIFNAKATLFLLFSLLITVAAFNLVSA